MTDIRSTGMTGVTFAALRASGKLEVGTHSVDGLSHGSVSNHAYDVRTGGFPSMVETSDPGVLSDEGR